MDYGMGGMTLAGIFMVTMGVIAVILGIMWMFLPWILISKMDRMVELLEALVKKIDER
jgi:hypothetical protein